MDRTSLRKFFSDNIATLKRCRTQLLATGIILPQQLDLLTTDQIDSLPELIVCCAYTSVALAGVTSDNNLSAMFDIGMVKSCLIKLSEARRESKLTLSNALRLSEDDYCFAASTCMLSSLIDEGGLFAPSEALHSQLYEMKPEDYHHAKDTLNDNRSVSHMIILTLNTYFPDDVVYDSGVLKLHGGVLRCTSGWGLLKMALKTATEAKFVVFLKVDRQYDSHLSNVPIPDNKVTAGYYNREVKLAFLNHYSVIFPDRDTVMIKALFVSSKASEDRLGCDIAQFSQEQLNDCLKAIVTQPSMHRMYVEYVCLYTEWCRNTGVIFADISDNNEVFDSSTYLRSLDDLTNLLLEMYGEEIRGDSYKMLVASMCYSAWFGCKSLSEIYALKVQKLLHDNVWHTPYGDYITPYDTVARTPFGDMEFDSFHADVLQCVQDGYYIDSQGEEIEYSKNGFIYQGLKMDYYKGLLSQFSKEAVEYGYPNGLTIEKIYKSGLFARIKELDGADIIRDSIDTTISDFDIRLFYEFYRKAISLYKGHPNVAQIMSMTSLRAEYLAWCEAFFGSY